jgi:hypothetical protein
LRFDEELFNGTISILENARAEGRPVFSALQTAFPDLQSTTITTIHYQNTTTEIAISNLIGSLVVKYGKEKEKRNEKRSLPRENSQLKTTTFTTSLPTVTADSGLGGSVLVVGPSPRVVEFLHDGGQSSLDRFLAEFPEAA